MIKSKDMKEIETTGNITRKLFVSLMRAKEEQLKLLADHVNWILSKDYDSRDQGWKAREVLAKVEELDDNNIGGSELAKEELDEVVKNNCKDL